MKVVCDSLSVKSDVSSVPQTLATVDVSDKRSSSGVRSVSQARDTSPALQRSKDMSQSVSSADSACSLTTPGSV